MFFLNISGKDEKIIMKDVSILPKFLIFAPV